MRQVNGIVAGLATFAVLLALTAQAANGDKALADTDARRKTAENSVRQIKAKSPADAATVMPAYSAAASKNNAWLDVVCQAIQTGAAALPDVKPAADDAAGALVDWVIARNHALAVTASLDGAAGAGVKTGVSQDLQLIAASTWKTARAGDETRRTKAAADLKQRLQWKAWDDIR